jgi:single-strand DNA-binding protein
MATLNQCSFIGHLGKDPELQVTAQTGKPFTKFPLGVSQGKDQQTLWLQVIAWDKLADVVDQYAHKGAQVFVQGRLSIRPYTDKEGVARQSIEIIASTVQLLGKKPVADFPASSRTSTGIDPFLPDFPEEGGA